MSTIIVQDNYTLVEGETVSGADSPLFQLGDASTPANSPLSLSLTIDGAIDFSSSVTGISSAGPITVYANPDTWHTSVTVGATGSVTASTTAANASVWGVAGGAGFAENDGHINIIADADGSGISARYVVNTGMIHVTAETAEGMGGGYPVAGGTVFNSGDIVVYGNQTARGISISTGTVVNTGSVHATGFANLASGDAGVGIEVRDAAIENSGAIVGNDLAIKGSNLSLHNTGDIEGGISVDGGEIDNEHTISGDIEFIFHDGTIRNSGLITGDIDFSFGAATINNSGTINGDMEFSFGVVTIHNTGHMTGVVTLGVYADSLYDGRGGTLTGALHLGGHVGMDIVDTVYLGDDGESVVGDEATAFVTGGAGNDSFTGGDAAETVDGAGGDDALDGGGGADTASYAAATSAVHVSLALQGATQDTVGAGHDTLSHFENLLGSAFGDTLAGDGGDNIIDGGSGAGDDIMDGAGGSNAASYASASSGVAVSLVLQGAAQDTVGAGHDVLTNFQNLIGSAFADHLTGDANNNVIDGGAGDDVLDGAGGTDTLSYASAASGVTVSLALQGAAQDTVGAGLDTASHFENLVGSIHADTLEGDDGDNVIAGSPFSFPGDADTVSYSHAGAGVTVSLALQGHAQDTVGAGHDTLSGFGNLIGSAFGDTLTGDGSNNIIDGGAGDDVLDGGVGANTAAYASAAAAVTVSLALQGQAQDTLGAGHDTLANFQNLTGSAFGDHLTGDANNNVVDGGAGDDTLNGGLGDDTLDGGVGNDAMDGGGGVDTVSYASATSAVHVSLAVAGPQDTGGAGVDALSNFANITGSAFDDVLEGSAGDNVIDGGAGVDTVTYAHATGGITIGPYQGPHSAGNDTLLHIEHVVGSAFDDMIVYGIPGAVIDGGSGGNDWLIGGDTFPITVSFASALSGVDVSLDQQRATVGVWRDSIQEFMDVIGSAFDDVVEGDESGRLDAGIGNWSDNVLDGAGGVNTVSYVNALGGVTVNLALQGQVQDTVNGGLDTLANFQNLRGSAFADHLTGDSGDNVIEGGAGDDVMDGGGGTNTVSYAHAGAGVHVSLNLQGQAQATGAGTDTLTHFQALIGSAYADILKGGGSAASTLAGGLGGDSFVYQLGDGAVAVADFSHAQGDKVDLSHMGLFFNLGDVLAQASQVGSDVVIALGGGSLTLQGITLGNLTASDFVFSGPTVGPGPAAPQTGSGALNGGAGSDWLQGQGGNDTLHGAAGSDYLDGGAGLNTALYDGAYRQYAVGAGGATVSGGPEGGTDDLVNIQRVQFIDGYLAFSPTDTAGQVYRLYEATLNRAPDPGGLANWVHYLNSGASLQSAADGFVASAEFQAYYGNPDNAAFATLLYHNVLHRDPDPAGFSNLVNALNAGMSHAQAVLGFTESPEDIADLAPQVQQGQWVQDTAAAQAARLYDTALARLPDAPGLVNLTHYLESGGSLLSAAAGFVDSPEFQADYGSLDNGAFATLLYHNVLHRDPDPPGFSNLVNALNAGMSRAQAVLGFSESPEHIGDTAPHIDYGIWLA